MQTFEYIYVEFIISNRFTTSRVFFFFCSPRSHEIEQNDEQVM